MRRNTTLGISLAAVVAAAAVGWVAGSRIRSPAEIAARTAPPTPSLISVPVEERKLSSTVVVRGTVRYGSPQAVSLPKSALKPGTALLTTAPVKGSALNEGNVALTVSGRPVFVLQGARPAYRDIGPGAVGEDVKQLEESLARLGFDPGPRDGIYDATTGDAVAAWYQAAGWTPFGPTDEQLQAVRTAQGEQFGVRSELIGAHETLSSARGTAAAAEADVVNRTSALEAAIDEERVAQLQLAQARATDPLPTAAELLALEAAVRKAAGAITAARADLEAAQAQAARAAEAVALAQRRVSLAAGREAETGGALRDVQVKLGTQVPADEVLFFPSLPLRIDDAPLKAGAEVAGAGAVMTVSSSQLAVDAALSLDDAKLVRPGAAVAIEEPDLGIRAVGSVSEIADTPGTRGVDPQRFYLAVTPTDAPPALVGASVVLTVAVSSTEGNVLAVPVAALSVAADGTSRVQVQGRGGATRYVTVQPGLAATGLVAVTPVNGRLAPGDLVVVGNKGATKIPASSVTTTTTPGGSGAR